MVVLVVAQSFGVCERARVVLSYHLTAEMCVLRIWLRNGMSIHIRRGCFEC